MEEQFKILLQTRSNFIKLINFLSLEQIGSIPTGFNNSIAWNFAHSIISMQLLTYGIAGLELKINNAFIEKYRKGTVAESNIAQTELDMLKELAISTVSQLQEDYDNGLFTEYKKYETSYGYPLSSIESAIAFNNVHEGLHYGYAMAQKRVFC